MKKVGIYLGAVVLIFTAIFLISNINKNTNFVADKNYNVEEDLDTPKVIFVYSDPTEHHPQG